MGLFDRFKKDTAGAPDALTREALVRVRAVPGVEAVEPVDADTLSVTWTGTDEPARLSLADLREPWTSASGFDRIELMDDFVRTVAPPTGAPADAFPDPAPAGPAPDEAPAATTVGDGAPEADPTPAGGPGPTAAPAEQPGARWAEVSPRLQPVIGRPGVADDDIVCWPVGDVLEATVVVDGGPGSLPVGRAELAEWGVDAGSVRRAAEANQAALDPSLDPIGPGEPAWVPTRPAGHLASWLCAPDRLLAAAGLDDAVVLVPLATELVVVDPAATALVESILSSTRTIVEQESRTLWPAPLLVRPGSVTPWVPATDHPCAGLVEEMRALAGGT